MDGKGVGSQRVPCLIARRFFRLCKLGGMAVGSAVGRGYSAVGSKMSFWWTLGSVSVSRAEVKPVTLTWKSKRRDGNRWVLYSAGQGANQTSFACRTERSDAC